jgi:ketosteroid isomerase-like protein
MNVRVSSVLAFTILAAGAFPLAALAQDHAAPAQSGPEHPEAAAIAGVVGAYHEALSSGQGEVALELLAEGAIILESGGVETKAQYADHHLPGDMAFAQAVPRTRGDVHVTGHGDVAWAWSTSETKGTYRDREIDSRSAELMVLVKTADGWKISAIHWSSRRNG